VAEIKTLELYNKDRGLHLASLVLSGSHGFMCFC
jgi:hypothetical protein